MNVGEGISEKALKTIRAGSSEMCCLCVVLPWMGDLYKVYPASHPMIPGGRQQHSCKDDGGKLL